MNPYLTEQYWQNVGALSQPDEWQLCVAILADSIELSISVRNRKLTINRESTAWDKRPPLSDSASPHTPMEPSR
jgi:hypothetical protein